MLSSPTACLLCDHSTGMVTRVPLHLQLYTLPEEDPPETYAVFDVQPEKKFYSMKKVHCTALG